MPMVNYSQILKKHLLLGSFPCPLHFGGPLRSYIYQEKNDFNYQDLKVNDPINSMTKRPSWPLYEAKYVVATVDFSVLNQFKDIVVGVWFQIKVYIFIFW